MAMIVRYNAPANRALSYADKNGKARSKNLANLSSGMKINSAGDDAANLAISERMRVKLRALDQDAQNVQNGVAILNTAQGGIQGQIDLLRTIREKVIDAANDHNTEEDRQTIQKEIDQYYTQIENLAYDTDYNTKKPLIGDTIFDRVKVTSLSAAEEEILTRGLELIPDVYGTLDNTNGPFDVFTEYSAQAVSNKMSGGTDGKPKIMTFDFSSYTDVSQLNNVGFTVKGGNYGINSTYDKKTYVLTNDTSKDYFGDPVEVSLGNDIDSAINNLVSAINRQQSYYLTAERDGMKIKITTANKTSAANGRSYIDGANGPGGTFTVQEIKTDGKKAGVSGKTSGGINDPHGDPDLPDAAKATLTVDLSQAASDSGFMFGYYYDERESFRIIEPGETIQRDGVINLTKGQSSSGTIRYFQYDFDGSKITFTATYEGTNYNNISIYDGYNYTEPEEVEFTEYTDFAGAMETVQNASDSNERASWEFDLSGMTVDEFSQKYSGHSLVHNDYYYYKFYDSSLAPKLEGLPEDNGSRTSNRIQIDIDDIRQSVNGGKTLAQALKEKINNSYVEVDGDKVKFISSSLGAAGNNSSVSFIDETLRHYDINFSNLNVELPDGLYGKGFRAFCATDNKEWFNFIFTDGTDSYSSNNEKIKSINIDVSSVTDISGLVETIYSQADPILKSLNHHINIAAAADNGIVTLYDHRRYPVNTSAYDYQQMGAKIADGFALKDYDDPNDSSNWKNLLIKDLVIQHTDKANMNIIIKIPQMTLDHIFHPIPAPGESIFDFPVTDKGSRNTLLGNPNPPGLLDRGLKYLLNAMTMVGAQNERLEFTAENIITEMENLTGSESVIRDADMAKEMTEYTKNDLLMQSTQAVLAQANQSHSQVLNLLSQ